MADNDRIPTITIRNDTAAYLMSFDPSEFYAEHKDQLDGLFNQFAALLGEDPTKPARTIGLLNFINYARAQQAFDLTTSIAAMIGAHATFNAAREHNEILKFTYVIQETTEERVPFAGLTETSEEEACFNNGLRQSSGIRIVNELEAQQDGGTVLIEGQSPVNDAGYRPIVPPREG